MERIEYLYSRDAKKKVRVAIYEVEAREIGYAIKKRSGLLTGKLTVQPEKLVEKGKVKRTVEEQVELQLASLIKKELDKGYVKLSQLVDPEVIDNINPMDHAVIDELLDTKKKDAKGQSLPMLAEDAFKKKKDSEDYVTKREFFERAWWVSAKIDGVRTIGRVKEEEDGEKYIEFTSRTGKEYTASVLGFNKDPELIQFMVDNECEIDGEIYCHGLHLNTISGDARKQTYVPERHDRLKFYIFDMIKEGMDASARVKILNELEINNPKIVVLRHTYAIGMEQIMTLHDAYVAEEYEGAMARTTVGMYEDGKRSKEIWKFKAFEDGEFLITGIKEGARPEDMCFTMATDEGLPFDCKPMGGAKMVEHYRSILDDIIGKQGTVKYFGWTSKGLPNIAKFKCVRDDD